MGYQNADSKLKIFSLNSNKELAEEIAKNVGIPLGKSSVTHFSDGEIQSTSKKAFAAMMSSSSSQLLSPSTKT